MTKKKTKRKRLVFPKSIHDFGPFLKAQNLLGEAAEIGVAEGRSSLEFINWGFKKLYLIDVWMHLDQPGDASNPQSWHDENIKKCHEKLDQFGDRIKFLPGFSHEVATNIEDGSLDFVYIDGDHSYDGCMTDLQVWTPKVKKGGIVALHDYNDLYGVKKAANEYTKNNGFDIHKLPELSEDNAGAWFRVI